MQIEHMFYLHNERPPQERESCLAAIDSKAEPKLMERWRYGAFAICCAKADIKLQCFVVIVLLVHRPLCLLRGYCH